MGNQGICSHNNPYSKDEIDFLQDSAEEIQDPEQRKEIAKAIGRSTGSVYARAKALGIIKIKRGGAAASEIHYAKRRPNLQALKTRVCPRCGDPLIMEKDPLDVFDFRLLGIICGHSFYYSKEDLAKITKRKGGWRMKEMIAYAVLNKKGKIIVDGEALVFKTKEEALEALVSGEYETVQKVRITEA